MRKAHDHVESEYLEALMTKLGFVPTWISLVMVFVISVKFSVMFNGSRLEEFKSSRGIRQVDNHPSLFVLSSSGGPLVPLNKIRINHHTLVELKWRHRLRWLTPYFSLIIACYLSRPVLKELMSCLPL